MAFGFTKTKFSPIAIDFGSDSLKLLQIIPTDPPQLVAAASSTIPEHARTDDNDICRRLCARDHRLSV